MKTFKKKIFFGEICFLSDSEATAALFESFKYYLHKRRQSKCHLIGLQFSSTLPEMKAKFAFYFFNSPPLILHMMLVSLTSRGSITEAVIMKHSPGGSVEQKFIVVCSCFICPMLHPLLRLKGTPKTAGYFKSTSYTP